MQRASDWLLTFVYKMDSWAEEEVVKLINLYERNPCLYDNKLKDYRNKDRKRACEKQIAEELKRSGKL